MRARSKTFATIAVPVLVVGLAGCSTGGEQSASDDVVNVIMVNNPQMLELQKLTADHFTKDTGIKVNYTVLPENDVRAKISTEFSSQAGQYDVASVGPYEVPTFAKNGWLSPLDSIAEDPEFDQDDIFPAFTEALSVDGQLYAEPFYGESSFLMYRKDIFEKLGLTMPENPTWQEVADLAAKVDGAEPGMKGICLRGQVGWGQVFAPLTTVVNTFGGTWFDKDWNAGVDSPEFTEAVNFYVDLVKNHGEEDASQAGFTECLNNVEQSKVAMWYDATSAANSLESSESPVAGKMGYVAAPVVKTQSSGWLWTWSWVVQKAGKNQSAAEQFIAWASSKEYENLVGETNGGSSIPSGKRISTSDIPAYRTAAAPFFEQAAAAISAADPANPGVQQRPAPGIQFVAIPEFADMATSVSQGVSAAIAGQQTVEQALAEGQKLADAVGEKYRK
jgi:sorbitol/mannitol transport system substrate-binding protein